MKYLTMPDFKKLCDSLSLRKFVFLTENQEDPEIFGDSLKMDLVFKFMRIAFNPNCIFLSNDDPSGDHVLWEGRMDSRLMLQGIEKIRIDDEKSSIGMIFTVICKDWSNCLDVPRKILYTIVAQ